MDCSEATERLSTATNSSSSNDLVEAGVTSTAAAAAASGMMDRSSSSSVGKDTSGSSQGLAPSSTVFDFDSSESVLQKDSLVVSAILKRRQTLLKKTVLFEDDDEGNNAADSPHTSGRTRTGGDGNDRPPLGSTRSSSSSDKLDELLSSLRDKSSQNPFSADNAAAAAATSDDNNIAIRSTSEDGSKGSFVKNKRYSASFSIRKTSVEDFIFNTRKDAAPAGSVADIGSSSGSRSSSIGDSEYVDFLSTAESGKNSRRHSLTLGTINRVKLEEGADPLSALPLVSSEGVAASVPTKLESLTIRVSDEARIVAAMSSAAKKQSTGSVFSVKVDIAHTGALGIGVKDLGEANCLLSVSMLKRADGRPGASEIAGVRLGDIIFGVNFQPTREGSKTLLQVLRRESQRQRRVVHLQCWRCHQLCSDPIPGTLFPRADDAIVQAHSLFKSKVFNDWERWNFIEILLGHIVDDLKGRSPSCAHLEGGVNSNLVTRRSSEGSYSEVGGGNSSSSSSIVRHSISRNDIAHPPSVAAGGISGEEQERRRTEQVERRQRAKQMRILDLERNILQAKSLRNAICVRVVHTKMAAETVIYVLRVEDVESGLQWVVHKRYRDFNALNDELNAMSGFAKDIFFPKKVFPSIRNTSRLVEQRIVLLEQYVRRVLHLLTLYATMDPAASRSLRHLQTFLSVDKYIDCVHPPLVDDQRYIELMAYRFLNDFSSPACQQCVRFVTTVDLDALVTTGESGYTPVLQHLSQALAEVELYVLQQHSQQMLQALRDRKADLDDEQASTFVRRCVRRQVEASLFLPLRRNAFRITYSFIAEMSMQMQSGLALLQQAPPEYFMVDPAVKNAKSLTRAIRAFRDFILAYLPADQCQLLMHASATIMELHMECLQARNNDSFLDNFESSVNIGAGTAAPPDLGRDSGSNEHDFERRGSNESVRSSTSTLNRSLTNPEFIDSAAHHRLSVAARDISTLIRQDSLAGSGRRGVGSPSRPASVAIVDGSNKVMTMNTSLSPSSSSAVKSSLNLLDSKTLADPVCEMFHSYETSAPERAVDGSLPTDRYSQMSDFDNLLDTVASTAEARDDAFQRDYNAVVKSGGGASPRGSYLASPSTSQGPDTQRDSSPADLPEGAAAAAAAAIESAAEESSRFGIFEGKIQHSVVSADDFLPMFTYVLVQTGLPQLLLVKEMMTSLVDVEETYGEVGYYLATLEAATQHVVDLAAEYRTSQLLRRSSRS